MPLPLSTRCCRSKKEMFISRTCFVAELTSTECHHLRGELPSPEGVTCGNQCNLIYEYWHLFFLETKHWLPTSCITEGSSLLQVLPDAYNFKGEPPAEVHCVLANYTNFSSLGNLFFLSVAKTQHCAQYWLAGTSDLTNLISSPKHTFPSVLSLCSGGGGVKGKSGMNIYLI